MGRNELPLRPEASVIYSKPTRYAQEREGGVLPPTGGPEEGSDQVPLLLPHSTQFLPYSLLVNSKFAPGAKPAITSTTLLT